MITDHIKIAGRPIGINHAPYVIAEVSANHSGSIQNALDTITEAKKRGADAVKIQTYTADTMTIDCTKDDFMINGGLWDGYNLYQLYQQAQTPYEWHQALFEHAKKIGITLFSTPFDESAVALLESLDAPAYKIASFELTDLPLIKRVAQTNKPIIMSTGMANEQEIQEAVDCVLGEGNQQIILLHCISSYPATTEKSNLNAIRTLREKYDVTSGLSDHTLSNVAAISGVTLGACVIEKHFMLSNDIESPDKAFSILPQQLQQLVDDVNTTWQALGSGSISTTEEESKNKQFRRSIYIVSDIKKGEVLTEQHIRRIRPGFGLAPKFFEQVIGQQVLCDIERGTPLKLDHLQKME